MGHENTGKISRYLPPHSSLITLHLKISPVAR
jgi:hypothetical protein